MDNIFIIPVQPQKSTETPDFRRFWHQNVTDTEISGNCFSTILLKTFAPGTNQKAALRDGLSFFGGIRGKGHAQRREAARRFRTHRLRRYSRISAQAMPSAASRAMAVPGRGPRSTLPPVEDTESR